ncbi:MAG: hypothetical protein QM795_05065 [Pseudoxanthomonas sp.]
MKGIQGSQLRRRARALAAVVLLLGVLLCAPSIAQAPALAGLRVLPHADRETSFSGWTHDGPVPATLAVPVELGDDLFGTTLQLQPATSGETYRVRVQYETSLALGAEGPHLDLIDWKHCTSAWQPAHAVDAVSFVLPTPTAEQHSCFPAYTRAELDAAVRAHGVKQGDPTLADGWLPNLDKGDAVGAVTPYVGISTVRVRVEVKRKGAWVAVTTVEFALPMGC